MKKKLIAVVVLLLCISSIATAGFFLYTEEPNSDYLIDNPGSPKYNYRQGATLVPGEYREPVYNEITDDYRPVYEGLPEEKYEIIFGELPEFPKDFFSITKLIYEGKIKDYGRIDEKYWKQPEFYSGWFNSINDTYIDNDPTMWMPEGYGIFPLIKEVTVDSGKTIRVDAYLRTGFGTEAYQGVIFRPLFPTHGKAITGDKLFEQPKNAQDYISCKIINPDNSIYNGFKDNILYSNVGEEDWFVVLKPTYQLIINKDGTTIEKGFQNDWVRLLQLEVDISKDTPEGTYCIAIQPYTPCFDINQEFYFSKEHEYYGALYYPGGGFLRTKTPHFQLILEVK